MLGDGEIFDCVAVRPKDRGPRNMPPPLCSTWHSPRIRTRRHTVKNPFAFVSLCLPVRTPGESKRRLGPRGVNAAKTRAQIEPLPRGRLLVELYGGNGTAAATGYFVVQYHSQVRFRPSSKPMSGL